MRIIKEGKVPEHEFVCKICGCEFIASFSEYTHECIYDRFNKRVLWETFESQCPCCGNKVIQN